MLETLTKDMGASMRTGDSNRTGVLRLLIAAMKNEAIRSGRPLSETDELKVLAREAKQRRDSIEQYGAAGRDDLRLVEEAELTIIQEYLPQPMTSEEVAAVVDDVIADLGATDMQQMGAVIGRVMQRVGARAEGGDVSAIVRQRLAS